ncbi:hypothetical protein QBC47DRAFT_401327 [Echria macrotheca]|uniref:Uncharacterized protein n=1 Tax=Echria macrotheca TaxID=438768 RepID=A0AAJ0BDS8_9PEZI|nr:hypothetical protein QBC47DRAFT_401327 [Echria macrotheca]
MQLNSILISLGLAASAMALPRTEPAWSLTPYDQFDCRYFNNRTITGYGSHETCFDLEMYFAAGAAVSVFITDGNNCLYHLFADKECLTSAFATLGGENSELLTAYCVNTPMPFMGFTVECKQ